MWQILASVMESIFEELVFYATIAAVIGLFGAVYIPYRLLVLISWFHSKHSPPQGGITPFDIVIDTYPGITQWLASHGVDRGCFYHFLDSARKEDLGNDFVCEKCGTRPEAHVPNHEILHLDDQHANDEEGMPHQSPVDLISELAEAGVTVELARKVGALIKPGISASDDRVQNVYKAHEYDSDDLQPSHGTHSTSGTDRALSDSDSIPSSGAVSTSTSCTDLTSLTGSTSSAAKSTAPPPLPLAGSIIKKNFYCFTECNAYCKCGSCFAKNGYLRPPRGATMHWFLDGHTKRFAKGHYPTEERLVDLFRDEFQQYPGTIENFDALLRLAYFAAEYLWNWEFEYQPFKPETWQMPTAVYEGEEEVSQRQAIEREVATRWRLKHEARRCADMMLLPLVDWAELEFKQQAPRGLQKRIYKEYRQGDARKVWAIAVNAFMGFDALPIPSGAELAVPQRLELVKRSRNRLAALWKSSK